MKKLLIALVLLLSFGSRSFGQSPVYSFTVTADTAIEANATVIAAWVKADTAPTSADSVLVILRTGHPRPTHIDTESVYVIRFGAGQDSVPFQITLYHDTFPEYPDTVGYVLENYGSAAGIGADSFLRFVEIDTTPPATISWVIDTGSGLEHSGTYTVCEWINNPNPFYVRFYTRTYDSAFPTPIDSNLNALGGFNYNYTWDTLYAPPGYSTQCQVITISPWYTILPNKTLLVMLQNIDANTILDSVFYFTIVNDNTYIPPSLSFDETSLKVLEDTAGVVKIPITFYNPNWWDITYEVDTVAFTYTYTIHDPASNHVVFYPETYTHARGTWHDTLSFTVLDDHMVDDTVMAAFKLSPLDSNTASDTVFNLTITGDDTLFISFVGAAFSHLKTDSIGYVQVYTSAPVSYPISVLVQYLNGNAIPDTDFIFRDTTLVFPAFEFDTSSVPVIMLKNHLHQGNKQVNLQLTNVSPANTPYGIVQYTFIIIDDDSTAAYPAGILYADSNEVIKIYPNPVSDLLHIKTQLSDYSISIINSIGQEIYQSAHQSGQSQINLAGRPSGLYFIRISDSDRTYLMKIITSNEQ